jgi:hypothetical protein
VWMWLACGSPDAKLQDPLRRYPPSPSLPFPSGYPDRPSMVGTVSEQFVRGVFALQRP